MSGCCNHHEPDVRFAEAAQPFAPQFAVQNNIGALIQPLATTDAGPPKRLPYSGKAGGCYATFGYWKSPGTVCEKRNP